MSVSQHGMYRLPQVCNDVTGGIKLRVALECLHTTQERMWVNLEGWDSHCVVAAMKGSYCLTQGC